MPMAIEDMLANTPLFSRLDRIHLGHIASQAQIERYNDGQIIERQGELGTALHVIRSGSVGIYHNYGEAEESHLADLEEGDFFGEMALLLGHPRSATIIARGPTECIQILRATFEDEASSEVLWAMLQHVAERLAHASERIGELSH